MARGTSEPWLAAESLPLELGRSWASAWPQWFGSGRREVPRAAGRPHLALVTTELGQVVAKREVSSGWKRSLAGLGARRSRAVLAYGHGRAMGARGLATPEPLAVLGRPGNAVLVTRFVQGVGPWELLHLGTTPRRLLEILALGLAGLHAAGFRHRDLKASNLLLAGPPEDPRLYWTDLDGVRAPGRLDRRTRTRDLARLAASFDSAEARAGGVRAGHWPQLVRLYLEHALGRVPSADESALMTHRTRAWCERSIRRHLARGLDVR